MRGVKRKREEGESEEDVAKKLRSKLHHSVKEIKKAGKKVKIFETQKLIKKLKAVRKTQKEEELSLLEAQLDFLKTVDHEKLAMRAMHSKIRKDKILSRNEACKEAISQELPMELIQAPLVETSHAQGSVIESRLLSSKVLAQEIAEAIESLKLIINRETQKSHSDSDDSDGDTDNDRMNAKVSDLEEASDNGDSDDGSKEQDTDGADEWTGFVPEEGSEADELNVDENGWESGTVYSDEGGEEGTETGSLSDADSTTLNAKSGSSSKMKGGISKITTSTGESAFLPSLSVGFVGGDSDWSENESDAGGPPAKKNRRGQRARKAIWEKKYGKNANHLRKLREAEQASGRGSSSGRGRGFSSSSRFGHGRGHDIAKSAVARGQDIPPPFKRGRGFGNSHLHSTNRPWTNTNAGEKHSDGQTQGTRERSMTKEDKPLHPSWEAKRKLKEKQSAAILPGPAQGTRLKF